ncbi:glycoside hydrolase family 27 protein [Bacteroidota bacterium]
MKSFLIVPILFIILILNSCTNPEQITIDLNSPWKFNKGDDINWAKPEYEDNYWNNINPAICWEKQGYEDYDGYAWYRIKFVLPSHMKMRAYIKDTVQIYLGKIDDTDQTFLNGYLIGQNGNNVSESKMDLSSDFEKDSIAYTINRIYKLHVDDERLLWDEENVLAVRVHDHYLDGGMYSIDKSISMKDIKDYIVFNINNNAYDFKSRDHLFATCNLFNKSNKIKLSGDLEIKIENIETNILVYENIVKVEIEHKKNVEIAYDYKLNSSQRHVATYSFKEKNSHIKIALNEEIPYLLTPEEPAEPRINCAKVLGSKVGAPILFAIATSGKRPIRFYSNNLPPGIMLDSITGILSGRIWEIGNYYITVSVSNEFGNTQENIRIKIGDKIALTPPMGWTSEKVWGANIDSTKILQAAKAIKSNGLINYGWTYVNIDDGWQDITRNNEKNELLGNDKFKNLKSLCDSIHNLGLKAGIYSSPGNYTCDGNLGSYNYAFLDIWTWYLWGIDFLKYDWCSYENIARDQSLNELQKPYLLMNRALSQLRRNVIYNISQNGMGEVWQWGEYAGGNMWRTSTDIKYLWKSILNNGFNQTDKASFCRPGHWNDPGLLLLGSEKTEMQKSYPTINEQYSYMSLWCLLSAPLILSCDLDNLDDFTLNLLTNNEVIAINQDYLGKQAKMIFSENDIEVWLKPLFDGTFAVGIFNQGKLDVDYTLNLQDIGFEGEYMIRDLWRQEEYGKFMGEFDMQIPSHGVVLTKFIKSIPDIQQ